MYTEEMEIKAPSQKLTKTVTIRVNSHTIKAVVPTGAITRKEAMERFVRIIKRIAAKK